MTYVGVIGPGARRDSATDDSLTEPDPLILEAAEEVGRRLAQAGAIVVSGGLGGVMAAACKGAQAGGGVCVGILPGTDRADANQFGAIALPTGLGEARNSIVVCASDVLIAVGMGFGTLSEIAFALGSEKHVVGLQTWAVAEASPHMHSAVSAATAVRRALELARSQAGSTSRPQ